jgi:hypothetical protein
VIIGHNRGQSDEKTVVIDLLAAKRERLRRKVGSAHPALWEAETRIELATVTPIRGARRGWMTS